MGNEWHQGIYRVCNREKYLGSKDPRYLSSYEYRTFYWMDFNSNVKKWGSEILTIPYKLDMILVEGVQLGDGKTHKYITDIYCEVLNTKGELIKYVVEIKPKKQTVPPVPPKRKTKKSWDNYLISLNMFYKNDCKWKAAREYCKKMGFVFRILSEDKLF